MQCYCYTCYYFQIGNFCTGNICSTGASAGEIAWKLLDWGYYVVVTAVIAIIQPNNGPVVHRYRKNDAVYSEVRLELGVESLCWKCWKFDGALSVAGVLYFLHTALLWHQNSGACERYCTAATSHETRSCRTGKSASPAWDGDGTVL